MDSFLQNSFLGHILSGAIGAVVVGAILKWRFDKSIEKLKFDYKIRERAASVAEYLALTRDLKVQDSPETYRRANQLVWELTMWLPEEIVKDVIVAVGPEAKGQNIWDCLMSVRKILHKTKPKLKAEESFIFHKPNIGKQTGNR